MQLHVASFIPAETTVCIKVSFMVLKLSQMLSVLTVQNGIFVSVPVVLLTKTEDDVNCSSF